MRLVLLTEQTRDWEHGREGNVLRGLRSYTLAALGVAAVAVPVFLVAMPWLVRVVFGSEYLPAVDAARIVLVAAAIQLVLGWSKSLPVTVGRPHLRIVTHGVETLVLLPLVVVLGDRWGVTGAAVAFLVSTLVFAATWAVVLVRLRAELRATGRVGAPTGGRPVKVVVVSGIWPPDVGGPASHAPALADALARGGPHRRGGDDGRPGARAAAVPGALGRARPARAAPPPRGRARGPSAPLGAPTASTRRRWCAAPRSEPRSLGGRSSSSSSPTRRTSGSAAPAGSPARSRSSRRSAAGSACGSCARREPLRSVARGASSCRARTCARSRSAGASTLRASTSCRTRRPRCRRTRRATRRGRPSASTGFALGVAGRLTAQKALGDTLEALARVPGVALLVLGDGPERAALERRAAELGLADRVRFLGAGTRDDVIALFRAVDAALLTSAWENLPHTLLEALAAGTPVIATAVGGIPEVVRDGENGLLVPPRDVAAIAGRDRPPRPRRRASRVARGCRRAVGRGARRAAYPPPDRAGDRR